MAKVVWSDAALYELIEIRAYITIFDPPAAKRMVTRLKVLGESLEDFPSRGRPAGNGTRELTSVAPYVMCYDVLDELVTILHIRHGRRDKAD